MKNPGQIINIGPEVQSPDNTSEKIPLEDIQSWQKKKPFQVLRVSKNATLKEVKTAYNKLSKKYHPDMIRGNEPLRKNYEEVCKIINNARDNFIVDSITNNERGEKHEDLMNMFGISAEYLDYLKYTFSGHLHPFEDGKGMFNERKEIQNFLARTQVLMSHISFEYHADNILADMERLAKHGVPKEKLLKSIEPIIMKDVNQRVCEKYWSIENFSGDILFM